MYCCAKQISEYCCLDNEVIKGQAFKDTMGCSETLEEIYESFPAWPETQPLELKHQALFQTYFMCYPSLVSEFCFSGLFLFKERHQYRLTSINKHLYILGRDTKQNAEFLLVLAKVPPIEFLYKFFLQGNYIKILPPSLFRSMKKSITDLATHNMQVSIVEDEGDFDYLYRRSDLEHLLGNKFHKKRNHLNFFLEHNQHNSYEITKQRLEDVLYILNTWRDQQSDIDYTPIKSAILHFNELALFGRIAYVNTVPVAFAIAEYRNNQKNVTVHFEKADTNYRGLYQFINKDFAVNLAPQCILINREQDLGEEGLRKAKQTYRPLKLLKKYRVYPVVENGKQ